MKILIGFILIGVSFANPDTAQKEFIEELNEVRKEVATKFKMTNMHKLEYSKDLELLLNQKTPTGFQKSWRFTKFQNYKVGAGELLKAFENYYKTWVDGRPPNKSIEVNGYEEPVEHLVPLQTKIGCAIRIFNGNTPNVVCFLGPEGSLDSFYSSLNTPGICSSGYLFIDGLCSPKDDIEVNYGSGSKTPQPLIVTENSQSMEMTTKVSQDLETLKPEDPLPSAPPVGSRASGSHNLSFKTSNQTGDSTVNSKITPAPSVDVPETTTESELDRKIAAYLANEQDGDVPSEEDVTKYVYSNSEEVSVLISVVFVMVSVWIE